MACIPTTLTRSAGSQSRIPSKSVVMVENVRTSLRRRRPAPDTRMHT